MLDTLSPLTALQHALASGEIDPVGIARKYAANANENALRNTYLRFEESEMLRDAEELQFRFAVADPRPPLYGIPISLKDCFDLAGARTTCGTKFYERHHPPAEWDSAVARRLREAGCLIIGKTHLHPLAYGITGQNPDYGDCLQPRDAALLTGGSSSGAAASVQEGSALAAIGTDTGGSIRVPAALCGLVGFRCSHGLTTAKGAWPDAWVGGAHLAPSFDTIGLLLPDPRDAAPLVSTIFGISPVDASYRPRVVCIAESFLHDCEPDVLAAYRAWKTQLEHAGAELDEVDPHWWHDAIEIFAGIQAHEAAGLHRGHFAEFQPAIAQRLEWGASLTIAEVEALRMRQHVFKMRMAALLERCDFLMMPCAPVSRLAADADQSLVRQAILRYTTPVSLAGLPAVALPGELLGEALGTGVQIAARSGKDASLLAFTTWAAYSLAG